MARELDRRDFLRIGVGIAAATLLDACGNNNTSTASPSPSASPSASDIRGAVGSANAAATAPAVAPTIKAAAAASGEGPSLCDVLAITSLPARPDANVNGIPVRLQVRDTNACARPLWYNETGVNSGTNFRLNMPQGWSAVTASVTVEVQREGGKAQQFKDTPVVRIDGPFQGGIGEFEGSFGVVPTEWADAYVTDRLKIQRVQTKKPDLQVTVFKD